MKKRLALLAAIASAVTLMACSSNEETTATGASQPEALPVLVTAKERQEAYISNLGRGVLTVDGQGCLRHGSAFVIWPYGSRIERTPAGVLQVTDGASGKVVQVGQEIGMSGTEGNEPPEASRLARAIPTQCSGPYKWGGPVMTQAELHAMDERDRNRVPVPVPTKTK